MSNKIILVVLASLFASLVTAQTINCKTQLESLKNDIKTDSAKLSLEINTFNDLKNQIKVDLLNDSIVAIVTILKEKQESINSLKKKINKAITNFESLKDVCVDNNALTDDELKSLIKDLNLIKHKNEITEETKTTEKQTYIYFNKEQIIKGNAIINKGIQGKILNDIISQTNQNTYLGDITIPKDGEEFFFYKAADKDSISKLRYKFKSIDVQISDGNFYDIRLKIEYQNQLYLFENFKAVSFFRFNRMARRNYLQYSNKQPFGIEESLLKIEKLKIRLSDILYYEYKIGNNHIPSNLVLELPKNDINDEQTNLNSPATYQIKENTFLDKIIELRAYTDFLALFDDADNGLLQIEGSAKFYIFPFSFQIPYSTGQVEFLKSATPYVNYARFENENRFATAISGNFNQVLDVIEKRYLTMGVKLNLIELYHKNYPIKATLFAVTDYNLTQGQNDILEAENIKSLGYGFGLNIASKRFNNFGFSYNLELKWFDLENFNTTNNIATDINIPVFKNQAEIFYHPTNNPNQAIFARLSTFNYKGDDNNQAFYQFQFGYKFSLGSRTVTK